MAKPPPNYEVSTGAANVVLNVRVEPDSYAKLLGTLNPKAKGIEGMRLNRFRTEPFWSLHIIAKWATYLEVG